ncbi:probable polygalacturonase isoform X2 [Cryptomeria japonica]|uniref:probable polygalacturonase isoform X2 n=1 Tax=Cryptomeria japonica TaxID=3369 RepID=UPI0025AC128A|nr:probable polygalacturonase isoform X2 [Cryptomeria japonica]
MCISYSSVTCLVFQLLLLVHSCIAEAGLEFFHGRHEAFREHNTFDTRLQQQQQRECKETRAMPLRPHSVTITEFGAVGDGVTVNTHAFQNAIFYIHTFADKGGAQLFVPEGKWLTGSFNLTSHLTLYLDAKAVILGSQDSEDWPVIDPLPSYGRGRELPGGRHCSLIHGSNLTDVVITGDNGTIDGQGAIWWHWFRNHTLDYTRPHLVELIDSTDIIVANLTFLNSPFWTIHPVYCSNVRIRNLTILAPLDSPNTDGIDPDSCSDVCIEDCYISCGDDVISIKSGWDEYGIAYGRPSSNIIIRRIIGESHTSSGIALGSEMSGGIKGIHVQDLYIFNTRRGLRIKTTPGRGGYVKDVYITNVTMKSVRVGICFTGLYGDHPDNGYDPSALPDIERITFTGIVGDNITTAGSLEGNERIQFKDICLSNIVFNVTSQPFWNCTNVKGFSDSVSPEPCTELQEPIPPYSSVCYSSYISGTCKDH